jgi:N-acetylmuramoyl-L-alanine amidase
MVQLNYEVKHLNINPYSRTGWKLLKVQAVVDHWTANFGGDAEMHYRYFNNLSGRYAGAHIFVDRYKALEIIPLDEVAFHCNDGGTSKLKIPSLKASSSYYPYGNGNLLTIGIEMCVEKDGTIHPDTIARTALVHKYLQSKFPQLRDTKNRFVRHFDVTGKQCPAPMVKNPSLYDELLRMTDEEPKLENNKEEIKVAEVNNNEASKWAEAIWERAQKNGYFDGSNPKENITREQTAAVIERVVNNISQYVIDPLKVRVEELEKKVKELENK